MDSIILLCFPNKASISCVQSYDINSHIFCCAVCQNQIIGLNVDNTECNVIEIYARVNECCK